MLESRKLLLYRSQIPGDFRQSIRIRFGLSEFQQYLGVLERPLQACYLSEDRLVAGETARDKASTFLIVPEPGIRGGLSELF
jgi:hypothetical protein